MAKVELNPLFGRVSGKVGNVIFRQMANGTVSVSPAPARSMAKPSEAQKAHRQRFKEAAAYARAVLADPELRARYEAEARPGETPYNLALADYLKNRNPPSSSRRDTAFGTV